MHASDHVVCFLFLEMMAVVYNFIRIDTDTFLTNAKHIEITIAMSKSVRSLYHFVVFLWHFLLSGISRRSWGRSSNVRL